MAMFTSNIDRMRRAIRLMQRVRLKSILIDVEKDLKNFYEAMKQVAQEFPFLAHFKVPTPLRNRWRVNIDSIKIVEDEEGKPVLIDIVDVASNSTIAQVKGETSLAAINAACIAATPELLDFVVWLSNEETEYSANAATLLEGLFGKGVDLDELLHNVKHQITVYETAYANEQPGKED